MEASPRKRKKVLGEISVNVNPNLKEERKREVHRVITEERTVGSALLGPATPRAIAGPPHPCATAKPAKLGRWLGQLKQGLTPGKGKKRRESQGYAENCSSSGGGGGRGEKVGDYGTTQPATRILLAGSSSSSKTADSGAGCGSTVMTAGLSSVSDFWACGETVRTRGGAVQTTTPPTRLDSKRPIVHVCHYSSSVGISNGTSVVCNLDNKRRHLTDEYSSSIEERSCVDQYAGGVPVRCTSADHTFGAIVQSQPASPVTFAAYGRGGGQSQSLVAVTSICRDPHEWCSEHSPVCVLGPSSITSSSSSIASFADYSNTSTSASLSECMLDASSSASCTVNACGELAFAKPSDQVSVDGLVDSLIFNSPVLKSKASASSLKSSCANSASDFADSLIVNSPALKPRNSEPNPRDFVNPPLPVVTIPTNLKPKASSNSLHNRLVSKLAFATLDIRPYPSSNRGTGNLGARESVLVPGQLAREGKLCGETPQQLEAKLSSGLNNWDSKCTAEKVNVAGKPKTVDLIDQQCVKGKEKCDRQQQCNHHILSGPPNVNAEPEHSVVDRCLQELCYDNKEEGDSQKERRFSFKEERSVINNGCSVQAINNYTEYRGHVARDHLTMDVETPQLLSASLYVGGGVADRCVHFGVRNSCRGIPGLLRPHSLPRGVPTSGTVTEVENGTVTKGRAVSELCVEEHDAATAEDREGQRSVSLEPQHRVELAKLPDETGGDEDDYDYVRLASLHHLHHYQQKDSDFLRHQHRPLFRSKAIIDLPNLTTPQKPDSSTSIPSLLGSGAASSIISDSFGSQQATPAVLDLNNISVECVSSLAANHLVGEDCRSAGKWCDNLYSDYSFYDSVSTDHTCKRCIVDSSHPSRAGGRCAYDVQTDCATAVNDHGVCRTPTSDSVVNVASVTSGSEYSVVPSRSWDKSADSGKAGHLRSRDRNTHSQENRTVSPYNSCSLPPPILTLSYPDIHGCKDFGRVTPVLVQPVRKESQAEEDWSTGATPGGCPRTGTQRETGGLAVTVKRMSHTEHSNAPFCIHRLQALTQHSALSTEHRRAGQSPITNGLYMGLPPKREDKGPRVEGDTPRLLCSRVRKHIHRHRKLASAAKAKPDPLAYASLDVAQYHHEHIYETLFGEISEGESINANGKTAENDQQKRDRQGVDKEKDVRAERCLQWIHSVQDRQGYYPDAHGDDSLITGHASLTRHTVRHTENGYGARAKEPIQTQSDLHRNHLQDRLPHKHNSLKGQRVQNALTDDRIGIVGQQQTVGNGDARTIVKKLRFRDSVEAFSASDHSGTVTKEGGDYTVLCGDVSLDATLCDKPSNNNSTRGLHDTAFSCDICDDEDDTVIDDSHNFHFNNDDGDDSDGDFTLTDARPANPSVLDSTEVSNETVITGNVNFQRTVEKPLANVLPNTQLSAGSRKIRTSPTKRPNSDYPTMCGKENTYEVLLPPQKPRPLSTAKVQLRLAPSSGKAKPQSKIRGKPWPAGLVLAARLTCWVGLLIARTSRHCGILTRQRRHNKMRQAQNWRGKILPARKCRYKTVPAKRRTLCEIIQAAKRPGKILKPSPKRRYKILKPSPKRRYTILKPSPKRR